jgi:SAM-dependent methyltransferase
MALESTLLEHERAWNERPYLRRLYREWFELIRSHLADVDGPSVELGAGLGLFREVAPFAVATDVEATRWVSDVVNAEQMPYEDGSVANLILFDVFHHLPHPRRFLDQAQRVLRAGGRVVALEPYCSPVSTVAYRRAHHEPVDLTVDPFDDGDHSTAEAMDSNTALPTLAFFEYRDELERSWPGLHVAERRLLSFVEYPLSGGFSRPPLIPPPLYRPVHIVERALEPFARLLAFRVLVVVERR